MNTPGFQPNRFGSFIEKSRETFIRSPSSISTESNLYFKEADIIHQTALKFLLEKL